VIAEGIRINFVLLERPWRLEILLKLTCKAELLQIRRRSVWIELIEKELGLVGGQLPMTLCDLFVQAGDIAGLNSGHDSIRTVR
jgi:hypothetical protein